MAASTWTWVGTTTAWADAANWTLIAGTGNTNDYPAAGDTVLLNSGSVQPLVITGSVLSDNTIDLSGGAVLDFANGSTLDASSVVNSTSGTISVSGVFNDFGNIQAIQRDALLVVELNGGTLVSNGAAPSGDIGLNVGQSGVPNSGTLYLLGGALANQEVHVNDGTAVVTSALLGNDLLSVNGGLLEIAQPTTVSPGQISFVPGGNDSTVKFDAPGNFDGDGNGQIVGFAGLDTIDLGVNTIGTIVYSINTTYGIGTLVAENPSATPLFTTLLTGGDAGDFQQGTFAVSGGRAGSFDVTQGSGQDTLITEEAAICFCAGTLITTPEGDRPVEHLAVGDLVLTYEGKVRAIVWIGQGRVLATRGRRTAATPVIIRKGALADNVPHHDLRVTKGHSLYLDDVLIPVEFLVNHRSIAWDDRAQEVTLYHIELASHDILVANGAPAESYRDDGNRWLFRNANSGWDLPPQAPCARVLTGGPLVDAAWQRLLERAGGRPGIATTDDPDLHLEIGTERIDPVSQHGSAYIFALRDQPADVRLVSRAGVPAELGVARDPRLLGVAVLRIALRQGTRFRVLQAADPALTEGFHAFEADGGLRWTDGDAALPAALFQDFDAPMELVLHIGATTQYPLRGAVMATATG